VPSSSGATWRSGSGYRQVGWGKSVSDRQVGDTDPLDVANLPPARLEPEAGEHVPTEVLRGQQLHLGRTLGHHRRVDAGVTWDREHADDVELRDP